MSYMPKSKSDIHESPDRVYTIIENYWGYCKDDLFDPCPVNPQWDALKRDWSPLNYVNPPYTLLKEFVHKALVEYMKNRATIMLLPSKTDQAWFHELVSLKFEVFWIRGRLKFKNNKWNAPQPHFLVMIE